MPAVIDVLLCFCRCLARAGSHEEVVTGNCSFDAEPEQVHCLLAILSGPCGDAEACPIWLGLALIKLVFLAITLNS
jgi:hypothetical protein